MAFVKSFGQGKGDSGSRPDHGRLFDAEFHCEGIGRLKADAPDVAGEPIGIFRNHLDRIGAIRLVNPHRARCADPMGMQEDHDLADRPLFRPTRSNPIGALRSNAGNFPQAMRLCFDDVEHLGTEGLDEFAGISRTNATDHPGAEIFFNSLCRGGRHRFQKPRAELHAMGAIVGPFAARLDELAGGDHRGMTDDGNRITLATRLYA